MQPFDLRGALSSAAIYSLFTRLLIAPANVEIVRRYFRPFAGMRILDIGCGPSDILEFLPPDVDYQGFDASPTYIQRAQRRYGGRGKFICETVSEKTLHDPGAYDLVIAFGVVHHLDDAQSRDLFTLAHSALRKGGRLVTIDGCFVEGQSRIARALLRLDRGEFVRQEADYKRLARTVFGLIKAEVRHDLLRLPSTHLILQCEKD